MALLGIDELNIIKQYFDEMDISEEEKKKRQDLCEDLFYIYYYIFALISTDFRLNNNINVNKYTDELETRFKKVVGESEYASVIDDEEISNYANNISKELVKSTLRNLPVESEKQSEKKSEVKPTKESESKSVSQTDNKTNKETTPTNSYWGSTERAIKVAQDMTNVVANYSELQEKIAEGYTHKTWVSILDTKTRPSHWLAWGKTVPIKESFDIGGVKMMCPCDHTAPAREVANCRCSLSYTKYKSDNIKQLIPLNLQLFSKASKQLGKKLGKHCQDYGLDPSKPQDRQKFIMIINEILAEKNVRIGTFRGQGEVLFYIKGNDVVVTKLDGEFVTLLKNGITNVRVKESREYTIQ